MDAAFNPLSRLPQGRRLTVAVRGPAGSGKSVFAASLAEADLGRLCLFDTERKARLLPGADGTRFDAFEIQRPDELPQFIQWALTGAGQARGYGCYALDSWTLYFGAKHRATLAAVRERSGDPLAQPSAEQLQADQFLFQDTLRTLCMESGACVVITDQIGARGKEELEENELGRLLPMAVGGLEYFVDVVLELDVHLEGLELMRVGRVTKSNSPNIPLGLELRNPCFKDLLARVTPSAGAQALEVTPVALDGADHSFAAPETAEADTAEPALSLGALLQEAEAAGFTREQLATAASYYHRKRQLELLTLKEIADLLRRMRARSTPSPDERGPSVLATSPSEPAITPDGESVSQTGSHGSQTNIHEEARLPATSNQRLTQTQQPPARRASRTHHTGR